MYATVTSANLGMGCGMSADMRGEIGEMQRYAEEMYDKARQLRRIGRPIAAAEVEAAAFNLINAADSHLANLRAGGQA